MSKINHSTPSDKIEIIKINLDIDIAEEAQKLINSTNDINLSTKKIFEKLKPKMKPISKKQLKKRENDKLTNNLIEFLTNHEEWILGYDLLRKFELEPEAQLLNKITMRIRKKLKETNEWELIKKRNKAGNHYKLSKIDE